MQKEKIDKLITEINTSRIFYLTEEDDDVLYRKELNQLIEKVYIYKTEENGENEAYSVEIVETVRRCVKSFRPEESVNFCNYLNVALALSLNKAKAKTFKENRFSGMRIVKGDLESLSVLRRFFQDHPDIDAEAMLAKIGEYSNSLGIEAKQLKDILFLYQNSVNSLDVAISDDSETTLTEIIADDIDIENDLMSKMQTSGLIALCGTAFDEYTRSARHKQASTPISMWLTNEFFDIELTPEQIKAVRESDFFDDDIYTECLRRNSKISLKEIAVISGAGSSPNLSGIVKRFQLFLKRKMEISL